MQETGRLAELEFFKGLDDRTLDDLRTKGKIMKLPAKSVLFRAKEQVEFVYFQMSGKSILYSLTHTGKRKIIFIFGSGMMLNDHVVNVHEASLFCETIEPSQIFAISVREFLNCMQRDFELTKRVITNQERKIWRLGHQLKNTNGSIYMERKLAAKLWKLSRDFGIVRPDGIEIDIQLSITFLADMMGAPRETTSRLCKTLSEYGLIKMNKKKIIIVSPEKMSHFYKTGELKR